MKKIFNCIFFTLALVCASCTPDDDIEPTLAVTNYSIAGTWQLVELNEEPLPDSTYLYIVFEREGTFSIYNNLNSMYPVLQTGSFSLEKDWRIGDIISGEYDYDNGTWNNEYIISDFEKESMIWTIKNDNSDVQKFARITEVPNHIVEAVRQPV